MIFFNCMPTLIKYTYLINAIYKTNTIIFIYLFNLYLLNKVKINLICPL